MANIALRPNVVLRARPAESKWIPEGEIAAKLTYHERLRMSQMYPFLFSWSDLYLRPTSEQRSQFVQFARGQVDVWSDLELKPLPVSALLPRGVPSSREAASPGPTDGINGNAGTSSASPDAELRETEVSAPPIESHSEETIDGHSAEGAVIEPFQEVLGEAEPSLDELLRQSSADLDPQQAVILAPIQTSLFVSAPPGTGKTYALIERICQLLPHSDGPVSDQVVVLSFTRATVAEIMRRLRERASQAFQDNLRYVNVRTFDSYATRLLLCDREPEQIRGLGYDGRIETVLQGFGANSLPNAAETLRKVRWLLVDEIQDLVGVRARLVVLLMRKVLASGGAVSLFGDPAQSIYDFQVQDGWNSARFLAEARSAMPAGAHQCEFEVFHRYTDARMIDFIKRARKCTTSDDPQEIDGNHLLGLVRDLGTRAQVAEIPALLQELGGPTAVLTRSNLQVEQLAQWCGEHGIPYEVNSGAVGSYWPAWIAVLFSGWNQDEMSHEQLLRRHDHYATLNPTDVPPFESVKAILKREGVLGNDTVDVARLAQVVSTRLPIQDIASPNGHNHLRLSTVHKAKGLEYDHVFVLEPDNNFDGVPEECRILYVAATRARRALRLLKKDGSVFRPPSYQSRELGHKHVSRQMVNYLYLDGIDDVDISTWSEQGHPSEALRQYRNGTFSIASVSGADYFLYFGSDGGDSRTLCKMHSSLCWDLGRLLRRFGKSDSTALFAALRPRAFATVSVNDAGISGAVGLGVGGFVVVPVIQGETRFDVV